jgi:hypothetical protein
MADGEGASGRGGESDGSDDVRAAAEAVDALQAGTARESTLPAHLRHLPERERASELELRQSFAAQEHSLRERYAKWILVILGAQFLISDAVFVTFCWAGEHWDLSASVIEVWLAATVVQIIGVALVVTRHLFPNRDGERR